MDENVQLFHDDCLDVMSTLDDGVVDAIICDLPYGTTACKWDVVIPFQEMWKQCERVIREDGVMCFFSQQPFTTRLIASNIELYRYSWIWNKGTGSNFQIANVQPLRTTEDICVFSKAKAANGAKVKARYFPILTPRDEPVRNGGGLNTVNLLRKNHMKRIFRTYTDCHPKNILKFKRVYGAEKIHPCQKPVDLLSYLIRTYTLEGETVLDFCMGSGSTGVACVDTKRAFIGIENDKFFFDKASVRISDKLAEPRQMELF